MKVKLMECWADSAWLCICHFWKSVTQGIKAPFENKPANPFHLSCVSPCHSLSLSLSLSQPDSLEHRGSLSSLFCRFSSTQSRRCSASSLHREGTCGLHEQSKCCVRGFIGFLCKPRNISLFFSPLLSLLPTPFILRVSLNPAGAGPHQVAPRTGTWRWVSPLSSFWDD